MRGACGSPSAIRTSGTTRAPDGGLAELAAAQYGVVARGQLRAAGLSDTAIARRVQAGRLHRVHRGVYAVGHTALSPSGRWIAAVLACGPGAVLSHASAAALWGLRPSASTRISVTVPASVTRRVPGLRVHRARSLGVDEVATERGIPVTSAARTVLDLAATLSDRALERLLDQAERARLTDTPSVEAVARAHPGHRGAGRLLRVLAVHLPGTTVTRSDLEERMLALCRAHALPRPQVNHTVAGLEVDFLFATERLVVETDGWAYHRGRAAFERDHERDAVLARAGHRVLRFTHGQVVTEPGAVAATIVAALGFSARVPPP